MTSPARLHSSATLSIAHREPVAVVWDVQNCAPPPNVPGYVVANNIRRIAQSYGGITTFKAYLEQSDTPQSKLFRSELLLSGVSLVEYPINSRKGYGDRLMTVDMLTFAIDNPAPATIILISGDRDYSHAVAVLRQRRYNVVVVVPPVGAHAALTSHANSVVEWQSAFQLQPDHTGRSRSITSPRNGINDHISTSPTPQPNLGPPPIESNHDMIARPWEAPRKSPSAPPQRMPTFPSHQHSQSFGGTSNNFSSSTFPAPTRYIGFTAGIPLSPRGNRQSSVPPLSPRSRTVVPPLHSFRTPPPAESSNPNNFPPFTPFTPPSQMPPRVFQSSLDRRQSQSSTSAGQQLIQSILSPKRETLPLPPPNVFDPLITILREWRLEGKFRPYRSKLGSELPQRDRSVYQRAGVTGFKEYVGIAENYGIVKLGGSGSPGKEWIELNQSWSGGAPLGST